MNNPRLYLLEQAVRNGNYLNSREAQEVFLTLRRMRECLGDVSAEAIGIIVSALELIRYHDLHRQFDGLYARMAQFETRLRALDYGQPESVEVCIMGLDTPDPCD